MFSSEVDEDDLEVEAFSRLGGNDMRNTELELEQPLRPLTRSQGTINFSFTDPVITRQRSKSVLDRKTDVMPRLQQGMRSKTPCAKQVNEQRNRSFDNGKKSELLKDQKVLLIFLSCY